MGEPTGIGCTDQQPLPAITSEKERCERSGSAGSVDATSPRAALRQPSSLGSPLLQAPSAKRVRQQPRQRLQWERTHERNSNDTTHRRVQWEVGRWDSTAECELEVRASCEICERGQYEHPRQQWRSEPVLNGPCRMMVNTVAKNVSRRSLHAASSFASPPRLHSLSLASGYPKRLSMRSQLERV